MPETQEQYINQTVPGVVTGASDNDPSGVVTYAISGIKFGYSQLWLLLLSTPMLIAVQSTIARIAIVTNKGLATNFREHFSKDISLAAVALLLIANILTIGADIAVMSEAAALLVPGTKLIFWVLPISVAVWYIVVFKNYAAIRKYFLWLVLFFGGFVVSAILSRPDWNDVLASTFNPSFKFDKFYLEAAIALLGTTITPYLLFWEARQVLEEKTSKKYLNIQDYLQAPGFILSNFVSFMIMVSTGTLLFSPSSGDVSAVHIAASLAPFAGEYATTLFALGILGAGLLAVPVLAASSASALAGVFNWNEGLSVKPARARGFYEVITASIAIGVIIAMSGFEPIKALFYSQVIAGLLMPPLLLLTLILANSKKVMGDNTNRWFDNVFSSLAFVIMAFCAVAFFVT